MLTMSNDMCVNGTVGFGKFCCREKQPASNDKDSLMKTVDIPLMILIH